MGFLRRLFGGPTPYEEFEAMVSELVEVIQGTRWQPRAVDFGNRLFAAGGRNYMMGAYALVESTLGEAQAHALSICWNGIGGWNGGTGGIQVGAAPYGKRTENASGRKSWEQLNTEGAQAIQDGRDFEAIKLLNAAIRVVRPGGETPQLASSLTNLAVALEQKGEYEKAESSFGEALRIVETTRGKQHPATGAVLNLMSQFYFRRGNVELAKELADRAYAIEEGQR